MFKGNRKYWAIFIAFFLIVSVTQYFLPKPTNWSDNYLRKQKTPRGCYAIYNLLSVWGENITENKSTLFNLAPEVDEGTTLMLVDNNITFQKNDVAAAAQFLEGANTIFIAATSFEGTMFDSLKISTTYFFEEFYEDSLRFRKDEKAVKFTAGNLRRKKYEYEKLINAAGFTGFDTSRFTVLAYRGELPCLIRCRYGKNGTLVLCSAPDLLANYFVAGHRSREAAYTIMSAIRNPNIIWDEYYKVYNKRTKNFLSFIFENDALYAAYLLIIFTIILYMVLESKRTQKAIPVKEPVTNSTLDFVNVISHVYYNSGSHHAIAKERIRYFYEAIRRRFHVKTAQIDDAFVDEVSALSGVPREKVRQLFVFTEGFSKRSEITEFDLIELNRQMYNFNKNSLR